MDLQPTFGRCQLSPNSSRSKQLLLAARAALCPASRSTMQLIRRWRASFETHRCILSLNLRADVGDQRSYDFHDITGLRAFGAGGELELVRRLTASCARGAWRRRLGHLSLSWKTGWLGPGKRARPRPHFGEELPEQRLQGWPLLLHHCTPRIDRPPDLLGIEFESL